VHNIPPLTMRKGASMIACSLMPRGSGGVPDRNRSSHLFRPGNAPILVRPRKPTLGGCRIIACKLTVAG
jgi:hypothetical protein